MCIVRTRSKFIWAFTLLGTSALLAACSGNDNIASTQASPAVLSQSPDQSLGNPGDLKTLALKTSTQAEGGQVDVWVSLDTPALIAAHTKRAVELGSEPGDLLREMKAAKAAKNTALSKNGASSAPVESAALKTVRSEMLSVREKVTSQQKGLVSAMKSVGAVELGSVNIAHNAVAVRVDASRLKDLAAMPGVVKVRPVVHYKLSLSETVPYVGGAAMQSSGFDGKGITIAVVDSGIDYTHRNLGGPGTLAAYAQAAGVDSNDPKGGQPNALFPSEKVIGGFDFVGDKWPNDERTEDPNPIDYWFHGTNVADIAAGASLDGKHKGMAPGAKLLAVKACASVSGSCNGIALLKAIDYALDPNGDGDLGNAADIINLSLGSDYGQPEDDLSFAVGNAVEFGVVVVASAGNGSNVATVLGSPSSEPGAISVAQTEVPSAKNSFIDVIAPTSLAKRITQVGDAEFAPVTAALTGNVVFVGRGCVADAALNIAADDPYLANPAGKIALIDRGACSFSAKIQRAAQAGAKAVIIGMVTDGPPIGMALTAGTSIFVPSLMIAQAESSALKTALAAGQAVSVKFDVASVVGSVRSTSARGPSNQLNLIKPEIGAPGASLSARVGTGDGQAVFGGTSGAAPMVSGAAALLLQAFPNRTPIQIKAMLMNTANTQILTDPIGAPGELAPITRIGGGELRVDAAAKTDFIAFNPAQKSAALSYGFQSIAVAGAFTKDLRVRNFSNAAKTVQINADFRYNDDKSSGAVTVNVPPSIVVPAFGSITVPVTLIIDAKKLPDWVQDARDIGAAGATFSRNEFDGYLTLTDGGKKITVPWHIMPRKAADIKVFAQNNPSAPVTLFNAGASATQTEVFALTGTSKRAAPDTLPGPGSNLTFTDLRAVGARLAAPDTVQFGISTFGRRSNPVFPSGYEVQVDTNRDGTPDFAVFNDVLNPDSTLAVVKVLKIADSTVEAFFFIDADFYSGNMILTAPLSAMGLKEGTTFDYTVLAYDNYFTGQISDAIGPMTFTPNKPKFAVQGQSTVNVPKNTLVQIQSKIVAGGQAASPSQTGLLFLHRGNTGSEAATLSLRH
jgi:minor extracellular serine protease Vpr